MCVLTSKDITQPKQAHAKNPIILYKDYENEVCWVRWRETVNCRIRSRSRQKLHSMRQE